MNLDLNSMDTFGKLLKFTELTKACDEEECPSKPLKDSFTQLAEQAISQHENAEKDKEKNIFSELFPNKQKFSDEYLSLLNTLVPSLPKLKILVTEIENYTEITRVFKRKSIDVISDIQDPFKKPGNRFYRVASPPTVQVERNILTNTDAEFKREGYFLNQLSTYFKLNGKDNWDINDILTAKDAFKEFVVKKLNADSILALNFDHYFEKTMAYQKSVEENEKIHVVINKIQDFFNHTAQEEKWDSISWDINSVSFNYEAFKQREDIIKTYLKNANISNIEPTFIDENWQAIQSNLNDYIIDKKEFLHNLIQRKSELLNI
jgi:hypothetical protein